MSTSNATLQSWVEQVARLTKPDSIHWCTGSDAENSTLIEAMLRSGDLIKLNQTTHPNCYLHRSSPSDVARVEHLTFVCTRNRDDAGPNNHWMDPPKRTPRSMRCSTARCAAARCTSSRTAWARSTRRSHGCGVEITDSAYVVVNMRIMTRMGTPALKRIERDGTFVKGLHSIGDSDPDRRFIMHFPKSSRSRASARLRRQRAARQESATRCASPSWQARDEGWLAEHMLIMGVQSPEGARTTSPARFPSACGKTNLAMLVPPASMPGWKIWTSATTSAGCSPARRTAARDQSRGGLLRRRARHEPQDQSQRVRDDPARHDLHQRRGHRRQPAVVGRL
jgi:phosphoenolpyruvate carboxykinase (GTP)